MTHFPALSLGIRIATLQNSENEMQSLQSFWHLERSRRFLEFSLHPRGDESKKAGLHGWSPLDTCLGLLTLDGPLKVGGLEESQVDYGFSPLEGSTGPKKRESCLELPCPLLPNCRRNPQSQRCSSHLPLAFRALNLYKCIFPC